MDYKKFDQEARDHLLKKELLPDVVKLIEKFGLQSTPQLHWVSRKENAHEHLYFKHNYLLNNDVLHILFRLNRLCFGKVNYFSQHIDKYEPLVYDLKEGFTKTELWNAEFLEHKASGNRIDLRYLQSITEIEIFRELCAYLESYESVQETGGALS
ncbi:MAG: hypothetical protein GY757_51135 [bacterium]|nr:hypothetical protein [bacterium]